MSSRCDCSCFHCERDDHYYCVRQFGCVMYRQDDDDQGDDQQLHISQAPEVQP